MADCAGTIIGIVAFGLHAAHRVYEVIDSIKDAPTDVFALKHDAKQIGNILLQLQQSRTLDSAVLPPSVDTAILKKPFEDALEEINSFIDNVAESRRDGKIRVKRLQWFLKGGRCEKLKGSLASLKTSIIAIVATSTSQSIDAVQALVVQLIEAQDQVSQKLDNFIRAHERWVAQEAVRFVDFQTQMVDRLARDPAFLMFVASSVAVKPPVASSTPPAASTPVLDVSVSEGREASTEVQSHGQTWQRISFAPRTSRPLTTKDLKEPLQCEVPCECCCHDTRLTHATPYWGSPWFGNLYLPRSFFYWSFASCNVQTCRRTQKNRQIAKIKFFFPSWFIAVDMKIRLQAFPVHFYLQTPRRVPQMSPIFLCIRRMDIDGVRGLLMSGEATVNDVDEEGWGVLHYAATVIYNYSYEHVSGMLQLLVDEGAHMEWEDHQTHQTPLQLLQQLDFRRSDIGLVTSPLQTHIAGPVFHEDLIDTWEDWVERCGFSDVHRAVLTHRTRNMSLKDMLSGTVADINAPCGQMGLTPLEWGIYMRIPNTVEALLECGADVRKGYPLHRAASWGDVEALRLLVHAGADIGLPDDDGRTPLHDAAYYGNADYVEELIRIGGDNLDLDALDHYGDTALDDARTRREYYDEIGVATSGHDQIILVLSELQASRDSRSTLGCSRAYIESVEDLWMSGSFPME